MNGIVTATAFSGDGANLSNVSATSLLGTISSNNIDLGSITIGMLATGAVGSNQLADGVVTAEKLDPTIGVWTRAGDDVFLLTGNVGLGTSSVTSNRLEVAGMVAATAFNTTSDRNAKENFSAVSPGEVLAKVTALPVQQWSFKGFPGARHIGPVAQDFRAAFGLGHDDKSIATVDADGVALAAIQGLSQKIEAENTALRSELKAKAAEVDQLKRRLDAIEKLLAPTTAK